ncbi:hypothetical protein TSUD_360420 [Trifolium subterraneum]|uniref:Uncharacterized protein n=1 Tax=Trifolium subterraneum TaxID=3900 RepID=A0A2Z6NIG0_TRISU|nr:hypothetical protein TSUD_360420 [Trifolium subterraneum]
MTSKYAIKFKIPESSQPRPKGRDREDGPAANGSTAGVAAEDGPAPKDVEAKDSHNSK